MSEKMGKNLNHHDSNIGLENHSPGCMWGIFHHFQHNRWHTVKKRLPRKRRTSSGKISTDDESNRTTTSETIEMQENIDSIVVRNSSAGVKPVESSSPAPKSSMKSRIKALITEEMARRRGRHRRSSSYPIRTPVDRTLPIRRLESSDVESSVDNNNSNNDVRRCSEEHSSKNGSCELSATVPNVNCLKQSEINKVGRQPVRDHTLVRDKSIYAIEPSKCASLQESKLFMDALDLLNVRKEVFLKILQDRSSSLAHQLHARRSPNLRHGLTKSVSFPASCSSAEKPHNAEHSTEVSEDSNKRLATLNGSLSENASLTSANMLRKRHDSKVALKRFKNLKEKIKHVIRDRKKVKNRIMMDAVHHKIPYGHSVSKDSNDDAADKFSKHGSVSCGNDQLEKRPQQCFKRSSSLNETFDRYNRLLEIGINGESKDCSSERLRIRTAETVSPIQTSPATLVRILSLPDLRSYSSIQIDDSASPSSMHTPDMIVEGNTSVESISMSEQKPLLLHLGSKVQTRNVRETFDDPIDSKSWESVSSHDFDLEHVPSAAPPLLTSDHVSENDSSYPDDEIGLDSEFAREFLFPVEEDSSSIHHDFLNTDSCNVSENTVENNKLESRVKRFYDDLLHVHVDTKNEAEFNYVKDVLELSGFTRDEILGKWHSAGHPVDPSVFEEVEGCLLAQPECSGYEEGGTCDQLLLFDLINEVLLDIYEQSFSYWPTPLTSCSHIHQMPKGYHVLEKVWAEISWLLSCRPEMDQAIDDSVSRDLAKNDGWMNLQLDAECVGLELEELIFDDLLEEIIFDYYE